MRSFTGVAVAVFFAIAGPAAAQSTGQIAGHVTSSETSLGLSGITLQLTNPQGLDVATGGTDTTGSYLLSNLAAGTYFLRTSNVSGYVDELYDNTRCVAHDCFAPLGTPILVTAGTTTSGIDIALMTGGAIVGRVTDAASHAGVGGANVYAYDGNGRRFGTASTATDGTYAIIGLPTGTYYLSGGASNYVGQIYQLKPCDAFCSPAIVALGSSVSVIAGAQTTAIDFSLSRIPTPVVGAISGMVTNESGGLPIGASFVTVYDAQRVSRGTVSTTAAGQYSFTNLEAGTYFVSAGFPAFVPEMFDNVPCVFAGCAETPGTPVQVSAGATTSGINIALAPAGLIAGRVIDAGTLLPIGGATITVFDANGREVSGASTSITNLGQPNYFAYSLVTGTYYVRTSNSLGYLDELYDNKPCPRLVCSITTGTPVQVTNGVTTIGVDFALSSGGIVTGSVTDEGTGSGLPGISVSAYDTNGSFVTSATTSASGGYSLRGLVTGPYFLRTANFGSSDYLDELYGGTTCQPGSCDVKAGTPVTVTAPASQSGIDFSLAHGGTITGTLTDSAHAAISGITVAAFNASGNAVTTAITNAAGLYTLSKLPGGAYYLLTRPTPSLKGLVIGAGYLHEHYDDMPCPWPGSSSSPGCTVTSGTPVNVTAGVSTTGIDFELATGGSIDGYITDASTNRLISGFISIYGVTAYDSAGNVVASYVPSLISASGHYAMQGLLPGTYYLRASVPGYLTQLFGDVPCFVPCNVTAGTPVTVIAGSPTSGVNFRMEVGGSISGTITDAETGAPIEGVNVVVHDADGHEVSSATSASTGQFATLGISQFITGSALRTGTYFVRTASTRHLNQIYQGKTCVASACESSVTTGTGIAVTVGDNTRGINFSLLRRRVRAAPATLRFAATRSAGSPALTSVTPPQEIAVDFTVDAGAWTATANQPWVYVTGGSGSTAGRFTVSIVNPNNVIGTQSSLSATITLTPAAEGVAAITIPVSLIVQDAATTIAPFGSFDTPANAAVVAGSIAVTGWALDDVGVTRVELWRDLVSGETTMPYAGPGLGNGKVFIANAFFISGARPDVAASYVTAPQSDRAGWGYLLLTQGLWNQGNGTYTLHAFAYDAEGRSATLGSKSITVNNAGATKPFGAIDVPAYGQTMTESFWNFGWALTPNATPGCVIGPGGVQVSIDSGPLQPVSYGALRPDIAAAFPGLSNSNGAGGAFFVDVSALANGTHLIGWLVVDSCGRAEGIGSRFFNVLKTGGQGVGQSGGQAVGPSHLRQGYGGQAGQQAIRLVIDQGERIELQLPAAGDRYAGSHLINGERRPLPTGSTLDAEQGIFYWQPGPGFLGAHDLEFVAGGAVIRVHVVIGTSVQAVIDTPQPGVVPSSFVVAGWAIDEAAREGSGIDTVHVWAYPKAGGDPIFLGVAEYGDARADVASIYGEQFADASFSLTVNLPPGAYDVAVFPRSALTRDFAPATIVTVILP